VDNSNSSSHSPSRSWAQNLCIEAFAERGIKLSEDDSVILVAAVFRRALDDWKLGQGEAMAEQAAGFRRRLSAIVDEALTLFQERMKADVAAANLAAERAVEKALSIPGKDTQWRYRMEGVLIGAVLVGLGALIKALVLR
jgi:hypothetical protein